ncbi:MAG: hemerythrin domain-containing protein [Legionella sp.]|nr:hemerythrin domain-containing protein [Legionella sp.]
MNAIDFLINEHNKVRTLFADINDSSHKLETKKKIFDTIQDELIRHEEMEQSVWYPQLKSDKRLYDTVKHLISEEKDAKKLMERLSKIKQSEEWENEVKKLQEDVEHHAREEEKELFPAVSKIMEEAELLRIGKEMRVFKNTYQ